MSDHAPDIVSQETLTTEKSILLFTERYEIKLVSGGVFC